ncbi:MAG: hypothetical protein IIA45_14365 [Bacteroidetes bacterium]|nr:hypothetical protein [Bacteroidota bacterium]
MRGIILLTGIWIIPFLSFGQNDHTGRYELKVTGLLNYHDYIDLQEDFTYYRSTTTRTHTKDTNGKRIDVTEDWGKWLILCDTLLILMPSKRDPSILPNKRIQDKMYHIIGGCATGIQKAGLDRLQIYVLANDNIYYPRFTRYGIERTYVYVRKVGSNQTTGSK